MFPLAEQGQKVDVHFVVTISTDGKDIEIRVGCVLDV
jgi:hypothetical protein